MKIAYHLIIITFLMLNTTSGYSKEKGKAVGFWTFGSDKEWVTGKGGNIDNALADFVQMKEKYGDQFQLIVEDLEQKGITKPDGTETAKIHIKIIIDPPSKEIESQIEALGLMYVE